MTARIKTPYTEKIQLNKMSNFFPSDIYLLFVSSTKITFVAMLKLVENLTKKKVICRGNKGSGERGREMTL